MKYNQVSKNDSPNFRIRELGGSALTSAELLRVALYMREDTAEALGKLYAEYGSLSKIPRHRIIEINGLSEKTADALNAISELAKREVTAIREDKVSVHSPEAIANLCFDMKFLEQEQLRVILLNTRNEVIRISTLYQGTKNSSNVNVGEVFREAVRENACSIIVVHNHPSGNPSPSPEDINLTRALVQAGKLMDVEVLDHVIIGSDGVESLRKRNQGGF